MNEKLTSSELDAMALSNQEVVILVHGTFVESITDSGQEWWHIGGPIDTGLSQYCQKRSFCIRNLRWDGENSELSRNDVARKLSWNIRQLERRQIPYHLVGHSHGGSIIWLAIQQSMQKDRLPHLRSWTTIGTPFLKFRWRKPEPELVAISSAVTLILTGMVGNMRLFSAWQMTTTMIPYMNALKGPLPFSLLILVMIATWFIASCWIAVRLFIECLGLSLNKIAIRKEWRFYSCVRDRHLAIWSVNDEAIAGLAAAAQLGDAPVEIVQPLPFIGKRFPGVILSAPFFIIPLLYNLIFLPVINLKLKKALRDSIHGNPFRLRYCHSVDAIPIDSRQGGGLSIQDEATLEFHASAGASQTLKSIRNALGAFSVGSNFAVFRDKLRGKNPFEGLIHNGYFYNYNVRLRLYEHITSHDGTKQGETQEGAFENAKRPAAFCSTFCWQYLLLLSALLVLGYGLPVILYDTSILPFTISTQVERMIMNGNRLAGQVGRSTGNENEAPVWYAAVCSAGRCPDLSTSLASRYAFASETDMTLADDELPGIIETIRWSSICTNGGCTQPEGLTRVLAKALEQTGEFSLPDHYGLEHGMTWYRTSTERLYLVSSLLGSIKHVPNTISNEEVDLSLQSSRERDGSWSNQQGGYKKLMISSSEVFRSAVLDAISKASPDNKSALRYMLPFYDLKLSEEQISLWDKDIDPVVSLQHKLHLAEGMICQTQVNELPWESMARERAVRPLERLKAEMKANYLWWGECAKHIEVARVALIGGGKDLNKLPTNSIADDLAARYASITEQVMFEERANPSVRLDNSDVDGDKALAELVRKLDRRLLLVIDRKIAEGKLDVAASLLTKRLHWLGDHVDEGEIHRTFDRLVVQLDWRMAPMPELIALNAVQPWESLDTQIVSHLIQRSDIPRSWESSIYGFLSQKSDGQMRDRLDNAVSEGKCDLCSRFISDVDSAMLFQDAKNLYNDVYYPIGSKKVNTFTLYNMQEFEQDNEFLVQKLPPNVLARTYTSAAAAASSARRFRTALQYAEQTQDSERLEPYAEILCSWQRLHQYASDQQMERLVDSSEAAAESFAKIVEDICRPARAWFLSTDTREQATRKWVSAGLSRAS